MSNSDRYVLCRFRTGNHKLPIETGRWEDIERTERLCNLCNNHNIGDEFIYVLECPALIEDRRNYLGQYYCSHYNILKLKQDYDYTCDNYSVHKMRYFCNFIKVIYANVCPP